MFELCLNRPKTARPQISLRPSCYRVGMARLFSMISGKEASTKSLSRGAAAGLFMGATLKLRLACAIKKALRNRKAFCWSGWRDSNSRPLAPHASALPGCATSRFGCLIWPKPNLPVVKHMGTGHPERDCKDNKFITHPQTH